MAAGLPRAALARTLTTSRTGSTNAPKHLCTFTASYSREGIRLACRNPPISMLWNYSDAFASPYFGPWLINLLIG